VEHLLHKIRRSPWKLESEYTTPASSPFPSFVVVVVFFVFFFVFFFFFFSFLFVQRKSHFPFSK
jgi:hypothetical protein